MAEPPDPGGPTLLRTSAPTRDDSHTRVRVRRVYASALDRSRQAIVRVEAHTGVVFTPLAGGPETVWPVLRRQMVEQLAVAPDGAVVAATLKGVMTVRGPAPAAVRPIGGGALCIAIDADGHCAAGTGRGTVWVGDDHPGFSGYDAHKARVEAIDRRGSVVVSGGADARVVWADLDRDQATAFAGHVAAITAVSLISDSLAVSGGADGSLKAWGGPDRGLLWSTRLDGGGPVHALAATSEHLLATGRDRAIWAFSLTDGAPCGLWTGHHRAVAGLHVLPDGTFWSRGTDRTLRHWPTPPTPVAPPFFGHADGVRALLVEGGRLLTASRDGTVRQWELATATPLGRPFPLSAGAVQVLAPHTADTRFYGSTDGTVGIVDLRGKVRQTQQLHEGPVTCLARPAPHLLVSGGADGALRTWDAHTLAPLASRTDHTDRVRCVTLVEDTVVTGSYDGSLARVSPLGGPVLARFEGHTRPVVGVAYTGTHIVSGSLDGSVRSWTPDGQPLATAEGDPDGVVGVVHIGGEDVVTVGKSGQVVRWSGPSLTARARLSLGVPLDGVGFGHTATGQPVVVVGDQRGGIHTLEPRGSSPPPHASA